VNAVITIALVGILGIAGVHLHRMVHGRHTGATPLAAALFVWGLIIVLYVWNPLGFSAVSIEAWALIIGAGMAFLVGYSVMIFGRNRNYARGAFSALPTVRRTDLVWTKDDLRPIRTLWTIAALTAGVLFTAYMYYILKTYGLSILSSPHALLFGLRSQLGLNGAPIGFYFFYGAEPLVPLSVIMAIGDTRHRVRYLIVAAVATVALLSTTGRTNAITAILWTLSVLLLVWGRSRLRMSRLGAVAIGAMAVLALFILLGNVIGKTYSNSSIAARFGEHPPIPASLVEPYFYLVAPLPVFSQVVAQVQTGQQGRNTFREILQLVHAVDRTVSVPPLIEPYRYIPYPSNVSISITPLYEDFGVLGVLLGEFVLGILLAWAYVGWAVRRSPASLCLAAMAILVAFTTTGSAVYNQASWLVQAGLLCWVIRAEHRTAGQRFSVPLSIPS
jgi:oligosaccharide repeat unit polymerase